MWDIQEATMASKGRECPDEARVERELELEQVVASVRAGHH